MSWSRHSRGRGYHHGNLKEALIEAALHLIAVNGPLGFTVAEAARAAGVSPAAPYRHYRDRDGLLSEIARRGFALFAIELERAWSQGRPEPIGAFSNVGRAYLAFARNHPGYYAAMFETAGLPADPELQAASDAAFAILRQAADAVCARLPKERRPPALMMALHVWALAHGIASLFGRAAPTTRKLPMTPDDLLEAGFLVYLQGVGMGDQAYEPAKPNTG